MLYLSKAIKFRGLCDQDEFHEDDERDLMIESLRDWDDEEEKNRKADGGGRGGDAAENDIMEEEAVDGGGAAGHADADL